MSPPDPGTPAARTWPGPGRRPGFPALGYPPVPPPGGAGHSSVRWNDGPARPRRRPCGGAG